LKQYLSSNSNTEDKDYGVKLGGHLFNTPDQMNMPELPITGIKNINEPISVPAASSQNFLLKGFPGSKLEKPHFKSIGKLDLS